MRSRLQTLGVHKWPYAESQVHEYCLESYREIDEVTLAQVREQLDGVYLIELLVHNADDEFDIGGVCQAPPHERTPNTQVPYDESFWSEDGTELFDEPPAAPSYRIVFFLHDVNPRKQLYTVDGEAIPLPAPTPLPMRLAMTIKYEWPT